MPRKYSVKRNRLIRNLATSNTLKEAMQKAGYSSTSTYPYRSNMKQHIRESLAAQGYTEDALRREFERIAQLCETKEDYTNLLRSLEGIQKYHLKGNTTQVAIFQALNTADIDALKHKADSVTTSS
jgi:hypothetical protein